MSVEFETITDGGALAAIEGEWRELFARAGRPSPYLDFDWVTMCFHRLDDTSGRPFVALVRENGALVLAHPLCSVPHWLAFRRFRGMQTLLPQLNDALAAPEGNRARWLAVLLAGLGRDRLSLTLALDNVPDASPLLLPNGPIHSDRTSGSAAGAEFPGGYAAYFARFDGPSRSQSRRMQRHMERYGTLIFRFADAASFEADFAWFLERKRAWTPPSGRLRAWLTSPEAEQDLRMLAAKWLGDGRMWLAQIEIEGERVALCIGFTAGHRAVTYAITYNPKFAKTSPGRTLMLMLFERLTERGVASIDFMAGDMEWKRQLKTIERARHRIRTPLRVWGGYASARASG